MSSLVWMCTPCERSTSTRVDGGKTRGGGTGAEEGDAVGLTDDACQTTGEPPPTLVGTMAVGAAAVEAMAAVAAVAAAQSKAVTS
jgi:hypothetical protein